MTKNIFETREVELFVSDTQDDNKLDTTPSNQQTPNEHAKARGLPTSDAALKTQWESVRSQTLERLYKSDPYIREGLDVQRQVEEARKRTTPSAVVEYDQAGKLLPPQKSLLEGGTVKDATEYMRAIRKSYERS